MLSRPLPTCFPLAQAKALQESAAAAAAAPELQPLQSFGSLISPPPPSSTSEGDAQQPGSARKRDREGREGGRQHHSHSRSPHGAHHHAGEAPHESPSGEPPSPGSLSHLFLPPPDPQVGRQALAQPAQSFARPLLHAALMCCAAS